MAGEGAPAGADLEHALAGTELAFLDRPVELPLERAGQRLVVMLVDALAISGEDGVEKTQEQFGVGVVVGGDGALVGIDLTEQKRLDEAPRQHERMTIVEEGSKREGLEHVALDIEVAVQIGLADVALVEGAERPERAIVAEGNAEFGLAFSHLPRLTARELDREGRGKSASRVSEERRASLRLMTFSFPDFPTFQR